MSFDIDPNDAVNYILKNAPKYAKAKAERVYLDEFRKSKKAILFRESPDKTIAEREHWAYAHPEYQELLKGIRDAVEIEEKLRWDMVAAQARIDIWKAQEYRNGQVERLLK
jgi:hypothetical protein